LVDYFSDESGVPQSVKEFILSSSVPLSISNALPDDSPLVGVNSSFCTLTGYSPAEVLGRNCRFMQPAAKKPPVCSSIRAFLSDNEPNSKRFVIPNLRKDGSRFVNVLYISKIEQNGVVTHYLGSQFDFTKYGQAGIDIYEAALKTDLVNLNSLSNQMGWIFLGSFDALSTSQTLIAQAKFD